MKFFISINLLVITIVFAACSSKKKDTNIDGLLNDLRSNDSTVRASAKKRLQEGIFFGDALPLMLEAAAKKFPAEQSWPSIPVALIDAATKNSSAENIPLIKKYFTAYDKDAKQAALRALINIDKRESMEAYVQLVIENAKDLDGLSTNDLSAKTQHAGILYPALLKVISYPALAPEVMLLLLNYLDAKAIDPQQLNSYVPDLMRNAEQFRGQLQRVSTDTMDEWENDAYQVAKRDAGIAADLLGHFKMPQVTDELRRYMQLKDHHAVLYAIKSLLRMGEKVDAAIINEIAADVETRNLLHDAMRDFGKINEFPSIYKTQAAFAESDMVNWLIYPTELGRKPDAIELMKVVQQKTADGNALFYLFRFKSDYDTWKKDGWMAGMSGYYTIADTPTTYSRGYSFSAFDKWEEKTAQQHFERLMGILGDANEKNQ